MAIRGLGRPGWSGPRKICAVGVRVSKGRSMHGFASMWIPIWPTSATSSRAGIGDKPVTSIRAEGIDVAMKEVVDAVVVRAAAIWGHGQVEREDVAWRVTEDDLAPFSRGEGPGEAVESSSRMLDRRLLQAGSIRPSDSRSRRASLIGCG